MNSAVSRIHLFLTVFVALLLSGCRDDFDFGGGETGTGDAELLVSVRFDQEPSVSLESRAAGYQPGDLIENINDFKMLVYGTDGKLVRCYNVAGRTVDEDITPISNTSGDNRTEDEKKSKLGDDDSGLLTYKLTLPSGRYYIYGVANVPDLTTNPNYDIQTKEALKAINIQWDQSEIGNNSQMFGIFTVTNPDRGATDANYIAIPSTAKSLHCWVRRLASKVTVAFDGTELFDNVQIYIEDIALRDVPKQCSLGNPNTPGRKADGTFDTYQNRHTISNGVYSYGAYERLQEIDDNDILTVTPENYLHVCNSKHPYLGKGDEGKDQQINIEKHKHTAKALYFFENIQGKGKSKLQDADDDNIIDYPNTDSINGSYWKDEKPYGTFIEVTGHYRSTSNDGRVGYGPIKYRFMLGNDVDTSYSAVRNTHYKLTLKFKGYGNDADWHIEYKEDPGIYTNSPQYISYLYNKYMYTTVKVVGKLTGKLKAEILGATDDTKNEAADETYWRPWGNGTKNFPNPDQEKDPIAKDKDFYYSGNVKNDGPWNAFLSLRKTSRISVEPEGWDQFQSNNVPLETTYNETYYKDNEIGEREYEIEEGTYDSDDGQYSVTITKRDDDGTPIERIFSIPLYTRANNLVTRTGFSGNNVYVTMPRKQRVKFTAPLSEGGVKSVYLDMIQVRRVVNPKGVWRNLTSSPFHVELAEILKESDDNYTVINSEGAWSAEIVTDPSNIITLHSTTAGSGNGPAQTGVRRIEGESEHPVDFWIHFNGNDGCAIVRVRYHNYTCEHKIFVRKGYAPIQLRSGGPMWSTCNVERWTSDHTPVLVQNPLDEGSMFRRGSMVAILSENNSNNITDADNFNLNLGNSQNYKVKLPGSNTKTEWTWAELDPTSAKSKAGNGETGNAYIKYVVDNVNSWSIAGNNNQRVAKIEDYYELIPANSTALDFEIGRGYGVLYGDGATTTQKTRNASDGYSSADGLTSEKGMRGVFVYNRYNGNQIFLPLGRSGYGRRKGNSGWSPSPVDNPGVLRYATRTRTNETDAMNYQPLFWDLYRRPGAIYWCRNRVEETDSNKITTPDEKKVFDVRKSSALDINYFTMGFEGYGNGSSNNSDGYKSDALFIRTIGY